MTTYYQLNREKISLREKERRKSVQEELAKSRGEKAGAYYFGRTVENINSRLLRLKKQGFQTNEIGQMFFKDWTYNDDEKVLFAKFTKNKIWKQERWIWSILHWLLNQMWLSMWLMFRT